MTTACHSLGLFYIVKLGIVGQFSKEFQKVSLTSLDLWAYKKFMPTFHGFDNLPVSFTDHLVRRFGYFGGKYEKVDNE